MVWGRATKADQIVDERAGNAPFPQLGSRLYKSYDVVCQLAVAHVCSGDAVIIVLCDREVASILYNAKDAVEHPGDVYRPKRSIELLPLRVRVELPGMRDRRYDQEPTDETKHPGLPQRLSY